MLSRPEPFLRELEAAIPDRPFAVRFWDGRTLPATNGAGPTFEVRSPDAFAHVLLSPGQLGLGRAYVSGALEVDDLDSALEVMERWRPPELERREQVRLALAAARAFGVRRPPHVPKAELRLRGRRHTVERDARAVRHHYDVSNEFFALFLDESMTYSCAIFSRGAETLEEAQREKLELVCTKLDLQEGQRVLDIGCGWGSFAIHAAEHHGVSVVGITLSEPQAELARRRVAERGLSDRIEIRVQDYRAIDDGPFDAVGSIGMVEHVGSRQIDAYARQLVRARAPRRPRAQSRDRAPAHGRPGGRCVHAALHLPRRRAAASVAHTGRTRACRARDAPRRGLQGRLRGDAASLGAPPGRQPRRRPSASGGPSGCASGGSTSAARGAASRPASRRSTRCAARGLSERGGQQLRRSNHPAQVRMERRRGVRQAQPVQPTG